MIEFYTEREEKRFGEYMELWRDMESLPNPGTCDCIEIEDAGDLKLFHIPTSIYWLRFRGEWDELYNLLKTSFPRIFKNLKFYQFFPPSGILI